MKVLIIFASKYGFAEKCAAILSQKLSGKVDLVKLNKGIEPDLRPYDKIVIGGPIYMGKMQKSVIDFCVNNGEILKAKKVGLFVCNMFGGEKVEQTIKNSFSKNFQRSAVSIQSFGGELNINRMNFFDKIITRIVNKITKNTNEKINTGIIVENIDKLASDINNV